MKIEPETLSKLLQSLVATQEIEIGCEDCMEELDKFVDMLRQGKDMSKVMPLVQHHLDICSCCREDFEALIAALEATDQD
jgi:hypothetical protein